MIAQDMRMQIRENPELEDSIAQLYDADPDIIKLLLRLVWAASTRKLPLTRAVTGQNATNNGEASWDSSAACIEASQRFVCLFLQIYCYCFTKF